MGLPSADAGSAIESGGRKRSVAYNTNASGQYRSVVDYDTEEQVRQALVTAQGGMILDDEVQAMVAALQEGQPVQKVIYALHIQRRIDR
jgi:hypothetical protein